MTFPDRLTGLAEDLGMGPETLLQAIARSDAICQKIEQTLRPFDLMGEGAVLRPKGEEQIEVPAEVWVGESTLYTRLPEYSDAFKDAMHRQNMSWNRGQKRWERALRHWHGPMRDRCVELCCEILAAGFACKLPHEDLAEAVRREDYEPEHTRWVLARMSGDYEGWFVIRWDRDVDDLYDEARELPGSRYDKPNVVVPADAHEAVLDFAERYDFRLSGKAEQLAEAAREAEAADLIADPRAPEKEAAPDEDAPETADDVDPEIDPDLRDDR